MTTEVNQNHEVRTPPPPSKKQKVKVKTIVHNGDGCDAIEDDWKKEVIDIPRKIPNIEIKRMKSFFVILTKTFDDTVNKAF